MRQFSLAVALALATALPVLAADLPPAPPPQAPAVYVPPVVPVYNWSGIYFGINGGYGLGTSNWKDPANPAGQTGNFSASGFVVGPTLGINFQTGAFVYGAEADFDYSGMDGKSSSPFCSSLLLTVGVQCETKSNWFGTVRGRAGYAVDRVLFYATAGGAFGNVEAGVNGNLVGSTKVGWTAGAGAEVAVADNWTARVEYLFVDLGNTNCNVANPCGFDGTPAAPIPAAQSISFNASVIRLGVDYKFRW
jgi:outer membrane immunogenic protein